MLEKAAKNINRQTLEVISSDEKLKFETLLKKTNFIRKMQIYTLNY